LNKPEIGRERANLAPTAVPSENGAANPVLRLSPECPGKDGLAHVLAEPNLTVMSGQPASFQAGGEYPYPVLSGSGTGASGTVTIAFKPYGVLLNFVATVLSDAGSTCTYGPRSANSTPRTFCPCKPVRRSHCRRRR